MPRCAYLEWPDGLQVGGETWMARCKEITSLRPDILITNELPFGRWLPTCDTMERQAAQECIDEHEKGLCAISELGVPSIVSSRPVWLGDRLVNEAFAYECGRIQVLHRKQYFPNEPGWREAAWFHADGSGFEVHVVGRLRVGVLLCSELMFNEHARRYGRQEADLLLVPRATGTSHSMWATAGTMAAIVSGCYVVSSNRVGRQGEGPTFGGKGFALAPDGSLLGETTTERPVSVVEIDVSRSRDQKLRYPCYLRENV